MKKRRAKIIRIMAVIAVLAVGLPAAINSYLAQVPSSDNEGDALPNDISQQVAAKVERAIAQPEQAAEAMAPTVKEEPVNEPDPTPSGTGQIIDEPAGFSLTIPPEWFYSYSTEGGVRSLNIGTDNFGPENPYSFAYLNDGYGFIAPAAGASGEAIGSLAGEAVLTAPLGQVTKKIYTTTLDDVGRVEQVVYRFTAIGQEWAFIFYAAAANETVLNAVDGIATSLRLR